MSAVGPHRGGPWGLQGPPLTWILGSLLPPLIGSVAPVVSPEQLGLLREAGLTTAVPVAPRAMRGSCPGSACVAEALLPPCCGGRPCSAAGAGGADLLADPGRRGATASNAGTRRAIECVGRATSSPLVPGSVRLRTASHEYSDGSASSTS